MGIWTDDICMVSGGDVMHLPCKHGMGHRISFEAVLVPFVWGPGC